MLHIAGPYESIRRGLAAVTTSYSGHVKSLEVVVERLDASKRELEG
jgi:hypothetical protein